MGMSKNIAELEKSNKEFSSYLEKIKGDLEKKGGDIEKEVKVQLEEFHKENNYKYTSFMSGKNIDFLHKSEWSLDNLNKVIGNIVNSLFGSSKVPDGVKLTKPEDVSKAVANAIHMKDYIASQCFQIITGIIMSFGSSTQVKFSKSSKHEPIGAGLHLFTSVAADSYEAKQFASKEFIYQYAYVYEVTFSQEEATKTANMSLTKLYLDQIETFSSKINQALEKLEKDEISAEQYDTLDNIFSKRIEISKSKLKELETLKSSGTGLLRAGSSDPVDNLEFYRLAEIHKAKSENFIETPETESVA